MKHSLLLLLVCGFPLAAEENSIELDPARTIVSFTLADILHTVRGTFKLKSGSLRFDPSSGLASGEIIVDVADHRIHAGLCVGVHPLWHRMPFGLREARD